ncbi:MAG: ABC transporter permease [Acidobacteriota bacterium]
MTVGEALGSAFSSLAAHSLRSALTMLGMIFGVGAVISMLSIGAGAERDALAEIERMGLRNLIVQASDFKPEELAEIRKKSLGLSLRDLEAIEEAIPTVERALGRIEVKARKVLAGTNRLEAKVFGVSEHHAQTFHLDLAEGRYLDERDQTHHSQSCVIGHDLRQALFAGEPALGRVVKVENLWFEVVGVLARISETDGGEGVGLGWEVHVPMSTARRKLAQDPLESPLSEIVVRLREGADAVRTASVLDGLLERLHGGEDDYELIVPETLMAQARRTQRLFSIVMGCIASISLLVGGIGIMNIMLATVLERTQEIGLRRAVGARRTDIRRQFLFEAFTISAVGGLTGVGVGVGIAELVAASAGWPTVVTASSVLLSTGVAVAVGLASGLYPAVRAARLDPIDALRSE